MPSRSQVAPPLNSMRLRAHSRGCESKGAVSPSRVRSCPIVPGAVLFDLDNGGDKNWGRLAPYCDLGYAATASASADFALGSVGAGLGATTVNLKGGLDSASARSSSGGCHRCRMRRALYPSPTRYRVGATGSAANENAPRYRPPKTVVRRCGLNRRCINLADADSQRACRPESPVGKPILPGSGEWPIFSLLLGCKIACPD
jgi:Peptidase family S58